MRLGESFPCQRALELGSMELDGALSRLEAEALAAHLATCQDCERSLAEMRALTAALRAAPALEPQVSLAPAPGAARPRRSRTLGMAAGVAAAAVAAAGIGALVASPEHAAVTPRTERVLLAERRPTDIR